MLHVIGLLLIVLAFGGAVALFAAAERGLEDFDDLRVAAYIAAVVFYLVVDAVGSTLLLGSSGEGMAASISGLILLLAFVWGARSKFP